MIGRENSNTFFSQGFCLKLSIIHHMFLMFSVPPGLPQRPSAFHISCPNVSQSPWRYMDFTTGFPTQGSTTLILCKEAAVCHKWAMTNLGVTLQWMHDVHLNRYMVTSPYLYWSWCYTYIYTYCISCIISKDKLSYSKTQSWHSATNGRISGISIEGQVGSHTPQQCMPSKTTGKET